MWGITGYCFRVFWDRCCVVQVGARFWGSENVRADVVSISDESRRYVGKTQMLWG